MILQKQAIVLEGLLLALKLADDIGMSQDGTKEITSLLGGKIFSFPKPTSLIKFLASIHTSSDDIILDFFYALQLLLKQL